MKHVLAISGGVDSVVLLDMFARQRPKQFMVAHFNHGIRAVSGDDAEFVRQLADRYQAKYVIGHGQLGQQASEQLARQKRYEFLRQVAGGQRIVTAHHQDDLIETVAINLIRGTGWRGLAPFWSNDVWRPLINKSKAELVSYAIDHNLEWVEDETNYSAQYFRNRVRDLMIRLSAEQRQQLLELNRQQIELRTEIEGVLRTCLSGHENYSVSALVELPEAVAIEVLRQITSGRITTPQLKRLLANLSQAKSGQIFQPGGKIQVGVYRDRLTIAKLT